MPLNSFVVFDLETTGFVPGVDEIIEIGAVKVIDGQPSQRFNRLVSCLGVMPVQVQRLTGITPQELEGQPGISEVLAEFVCFTGDMPLVAHNASFDIGFLTAAVGKPPVVPWIDTLELARLCFPLAPNYRLSGLVKYLDLPEERFHRASGDAEATAGLMLHCLKKLNSWDLGLIRQVRHLLGDSGDGVSRLIAELELKHTRRFPNRLIKESFIYLAQTEDSGLFAAAGGSKQKSATLPPGDIAAILGPEGPLSKKIANYKHRPGQVKMLDSVVNSFSMGEHLVAEAGTGTGKSLAYLVPAVCWAVSSGEKVAVSTHTINLQEQLWQKDIPLLRQLLPLEFEAALVKGRNNYLCLRKWQTLVGSSDQLSANERRELAPVLSWLSETQTGDRSELGLKPKGQDIWSRVAADSDTCLGNRCRHHGRECFVMRARRKAENADILILNHSLLLSDIKTENKVLPPYNYLVIDEAHNLEDSATEHLGQAISDTRMDQLERMLRQGGSPPGLLGQVLHRINGLGLEEGDREALHELAAKAAHILAEVRESSQIFFGLLSALARRLGGQDNAQVRLKKELELPGWGELSAARENLTIRLYNLCDTLSGLGTMLEQQDEEGLIRDINAWAGQCRETGCAAAELLDLTRHNQVVWIETDQWSCRLCSAPVEVGPLLKEQLFAKVKAAILTSATLSVNESFEHFLERVGLEPETPCLKVDSPFRYEEQALICIPRDLPDPAAGSESEYCQAVADLLIDLVRTVQGRTLVLFTSHKMLQEVYMQVKPYLESEDIQVLGHNLDGSRGKLVEEFKANPRTVLLGASSFWEGVDIQGDALSCVVIVKLPFWPPSIPTIEARMEELARRKKDGFRSLAVPQAVIRLKQGFGRLIRTERDRGVVVILDNRVLAKSYGRKFLNSLPLKTHIRGDSELILSKIGRWLEQQPEAPPWRLVKDAETAGKEAERLGRRSG